MKNFVHPCVPPMIQPTSIRNLWKAQWCVWLPKKSNRYRMLLSNSDEKSPHLSKSADLFQGTHKYNSPSAHSTTQYSSIYSSIHRMSIVSGIYLLNGLSLTASSLNLALFWSLVVDLEEATLHAHSLVRDLM